MTTKCGWRQLQEMLSRSSLPRGPTSLATSSMLSGPPHDVYLVSFWFVFVSIMFEYHQIMMTRRDSLRHLATSPPPGLMPLVPCNITEGFSYSSQSFVQFMFFSCVFQSYHFCILFFALVTIWFILGRGVWGRRRLLELWRSFNCSHSSSCFRWVAVGKSQNDILKMHI